MKMRKVILDKEILKEQLKEVEEKGLMNALQEALDYLEEQQNSTDKEEEGAEVCLQLDNNLYISYQVDEDLDIIIEDIRP